MSDRGDTVTDALVLNRIDGCLNAVDKVRRRDSPENLVVRVSQIETKVLNVEGVIDITGTKINGGTQNISLASNAIPVLGVVTNGS